MLMSAFYPRVPMSSPDSKELPTTALSMFLKLPPVLKRDLGWRCRLATGSDAQDDDITETINISRQSEKLLNGC
jgi:hypothetical protein